MSCGRREAPASEMRVWRPPLWITELGELTNLPKPPDSMVYGPRTVFRASFR
jgi:hypothetical protein